MIQTKHVLKSVECYDRGGDAHSGEQREKRNGGEKREKDKAGHCWESHSVAYHLQMVSHQPLVLQPGLLT